MTVPSPRPMARYDNLAERAIVETWVVSVQLWQAWRILGCPYRVWSVPALYLCRAYQERGTSLLVERLEVPDL